MAGATTRLLIDHVHRRGGDAAVSRMLAVAGDDRCADRLRDGSAGSSYEAMVALFEAAVAVTGDPDTPRRVGESVLSRTVGRRRKVALRLVGSPQEMLATVESSSAALSGFSELNAHQVGSNQAVVTRRVLPGYRPSRHDCEYTAGMLSRAPVLVGLPSAEVVEQSCQALGGPHCLYRVTWPPSPRRRPWRCRRTTARELSFLREQVASLQRTATDLVSPVDIDTVLARIAQRASSAVRAERVLLAVELEGEQRVQAAGFDEDVAHRLGSRLLADPWGERGACGDACLIAEVASARTRYGWVAAFFQPSTATGPAQQEAWDAYARLAAAALDMATALTEARSRGETAERLLSLGRALAAAEEPAEVAQRLAQAIPGLAPADRAAVLLWCPDAEGLVVHGTHGYAPEQDRRLRGLVVTPEVSPALTTAMRNRPGPLLFRADTPDPWLRGLQREFAFNTVAIVPIVLRREVLGVAAATWVSAPAPRGDAGLFGRLAGLADQAATALGNAQLIQRARHAATHDELTGLPNRALLGDRLAQAAAARRRSGSGMALLFVDLDGFKEINDAWGHAVGDAVLREAARRLRAGVRATDTVARYGGDEFLVLLADIDDQEDAEFVAAALLAALGPEIVVDGRRFEVRASLGVAVAFDDVDPQVLLHGADAAMYEAKAAGRGTFRCAPSVGAA